jgi:anion-transporting  ArsA/GET3 family ATPase
VDAARQLREVRELLRDPARARCLVVSRAAGVPLAETERLLARLRRLRMRVPAVVANAVVPPSASCPRCGATRVAERRQLGLLRAACRRQRANPCAIIQAPMVAPPPRGIAALERWSRTWMR